jgi:2-keto-3-deoxy-L-rhamnonate aldolase RhmA
MRRNRLRELLKADKPTLGTHIHSSWPSIVELVGHSGMFDYIEFVAEYAPYDLYALDNLGRAVDLFPNMSAMMKIEQEPRTYLAIRAIGSGLQNILFAALSGLRRRTPGAGTGSACAGTSASCSKAAPQRLCRRSMTRWWP